MRPPSKSEATGYDIVVWVDKDGDVVARAFTPTGDNALGIFVNAYQTGDIVQIYCDPTEFVDDLPSIVKVGMLSSHTGKIGPLLMPRMH